MAHLSFLIQNGDLNNALACAFELREKAEDKLLTVLFNIIINYAHSCDRSMGALQIFNKIGNMTGDNAKISSIAKLINFLINNSGGVTIPAIDKTSSKSKLDSISDFISNFDDCDFEINDEEPLNIFESIKDNDCDYDQIEDLKELYSSFLENDDYTNEQKHQIVKSFIVNLLTSNDEATASSISREVINKIKGTKPKIDKSGFKQIDCYRSFVFFDENENLLVDTVSDNLDSDVYSKFVNSSKVEEDEEQPVETKKAPPKKTPSKSNDDGIDYGDDSHFECKNSSTKATTPERKPGQTEDDWYNSMSFIQEKSVCWKLFSAEEKKEKFNNKYNDEVYTNYIKEKRNERESRRTSTAGKPVKVAESQSEKKIKRITLGEKQDGDEVEKYLECMKSCTSSSTKFFVTKSGHITYPAKLNQKIIDLSERNNEMKEIFGIGSVGLRCYRSNKIPVPLSKKDELGDDEDSEDSKKSAKKPAAKKSTKKVESDDEDDENGENGEDSEDSKKSAKKPASKKSTKKTETKKEEELVEGANFKYEIKKDGCLMYVTDVLFKDIITLDSPKFEKLVAKMNESCDDVEAKKEKNMKRCNIYDGLYNTTMFRWLTKCNEDFFSIVLHKDTIISLGETFDGRENNSRKEINKSNNNLSSYVDHQKSLYFKNKALPKLKEKKKSLIEFIEDKLEDIAEQKKLVKSKITKDVYTEYYKFILNRIKESDNILKYQRM